MSKPFVFFKPEDNCGHNEINMGVHIYNLAQHKLLAINNDVNFCPRCGKDLR